MTPDSLRGLREPCHSKAIMARQKQRQHDRVDVEVGATLEDLDHILSVAVLNISEGGVFVRCKNPPERWTDVKLRMKVPNSNREIYAKGVVVWRLTAADIKPDSELSPGAGIQFTEINENDHQLLKRRILGTD